MADNSTAVVETSTGSATSLATASSSAPPAPTTSDSTTSALEATNDTTQIPSEPDAGVSHGSESSREGDGGDATETQGASTANGDSTSSDETAPSPCVVQPLTQEFRDDYDDLDPFYTKYADAAGLPVVSSNEPSDEALIRVCELVIDMTMRADVRQALIDNHVRFALIGNEELTNDIPEFAYLPDSINERARGLGGVPAASCAEESILCDRERDRWYGEGICVHEFAHTISMGGLYYADPTFEPRLLEAFEHAQSAGLFANTYAMENMQEYWAEGVQNWYYTNLESDPPNGIHNLIDRREELEEYDPLLYQLVAEFLPEPVEFVDCYSDE